MSHYENRFFAAVSVLASHGRVKHRLTNAYSEFLTDIDEDELPVAAKEKFSELRRQMQSVQPLNGEGHVCASVRKMSQVQADECANLIVGLYRDVLLMGDSPVEKVVPELKGTDVPPPFLVKSG